MTNSLYIQEHSHQEVVLSSRQLSEQPRPCYVLLFNCTEARTHTLFGWTSTGSTEPPRGSTHFSPAPLQQSKSTLQPLPVLSLSRKQSSLPAMRSSASSVPHPRDDQVCSSLGCFTGAVQGKASNTTSCSRLPSSPYPLPPTPLKLFKSHHPKNSIHAPAPGVTSAPTTQGLRFPALPSSPDTCRSL